MESFKDTILKALPDPENSATRLRLRHVGFVIDLKELGKSKFTFSDLDENGYTTWTKNIKDKSHRITLHVAPKGTLCDLKLACFIDLSFESVGAPYGWYRLDDISKRSETLLSKSIAELTYLTPQENATDEWEWHLENLSYDPEVFDEPKENDFILCCFVNQFFQENWKLAVLLSVSLVRHIDKIQNPFVTTDLAYSCGRMWMKGECSLAIKRHLEMNSEEGLSNVGAVLCDNLHEPYAAL